jgi:hypothetical protein
MLILAHRGLWSQPAERNSLSALTSALAEGFGVETDVRDLGGELVVSHDPPLAGAMPLAAFLDAYARIPAAGLLALNIKADGLQLALAQALDSRRIGPDRYFVFDMAVPDALGYLRRGMPSFTRQSEIEPVPAFIDRADGIWLDCFEKDWINGPDILGHCGAGRRVALVSPELHGRDRQAAWGEWRGAYRELQRRGLGGRIMICTDHPREAKAFFDAPD